MGFGFEEFDSPETTTNVCKDFQEFTSYLHFEILILLQFFFLIQGKILHNHALILQPCNVKNDGQKQNTIQKDRSSTKLLIKMLLLRQQRRTGGKALKNMTYVMKQSY